MSRSCQKKRQPTHFTQKRKAHGSDHKAERSKFKKLQGKYGQCRSAEWRRRALRESKQGEAARGSSSHWGDAPAWGQGGRLKGFKHRML